MCLVGQGELGLMGMVVSEEFGGLGSDYLAYVGQVAATTPDNQQRWNSAPLASEPAQSDTGRRLASYLRNGPRPAHGHGL